MAVTAIARGCGFLKIADRRAAYSKRNVRKISNERIGVCMCVCVGGIYKSLGQHSHRMWGGGGLWGRPAVDLPSLLLSGSRMSRW